jgi:hypothetical protein
MKLKTLAMAGAGLMLCVSAAQAVHVWEDPSGWSSGVFSYDRSSNTPRFSANELTFDLFGSYGAGERNIEHIFDTNIRHGKFGGGVGINYFFTREIGIGVDMDMGDNRGHLVDQVLGSLIARFPIEVAGVAPYIFGGGGRGIDPEWEWVGHAGLGLEWRLSPAMGIFADGRYIWPDHSADRILFRAGVRMAF